jgi:urea transport system permease protein
MRQLQQSHEDVFGSEISVKRLPPKGGWRSFWLLLVLSLGVRFAHAQLPSDNDLLPILGELREAGYADKEAIVEKLTRTGHPSVGPILNAFIEDRLYFRNDDQSIVLIKAAEGDAGEAKEFQLLSPVSLKPAGSAPVDSLTKIGTNNRLRRMLRTTAARFGLSSPDAKLRLDAVRNMLRSLDEETLTLLRDQGARETNADVKQAIEIGLALAAVDGNDAEARVAAIATLGSSLSPDVRNKLASLVEQTPDGAFVEPDARVREAAASALKGIDRWRTFYAGVETLFFGLSLGSVLVLVAIGLAITFGVMGVINMAHGELMMLGAYTTYVVQAAMPQRIEISILIAIPAAFVVAGLTGVLIERTIIRYLYGRPLETLLATFGVSLVLQQLVRSVFSALNREVKTPEWMSGAWQLNDALSITYNRMYIVLFTLMVFGVLLAVLKRTRAGLEIRAVAQNRAMARAMGIRSAWIDVLTFGLGSGIAGIAGVALSQLTNVGPNLGQSYIIDSFMVVVFGGVGNLWGALIGGMSMGIVNKLLEPYSGAVLAKILVLVALILFIQRRPRGLFPQVGRSAENV